MKQPVLVLLTLLFCLGTAYAQTFNLKEMITFKDHDIDYFHHYVRGKGYSYDPSKYDARHDAYIYAWMPGIDTVLRTIEYKEKDGKKIITYTSTEQADYEAIKKQLALLEFKFVKYVPMQQNGRSVLKIVYSDGHIETDLFNSYIDNPDDRLVRCYMVKVR